MQFNKNTMRREALKSENFSQEDLAVNVALKVIAIGTTLIILSGVALKIIFF